MATYHTMRARSPGGTPTVYRAYDTVLQQPQSAPGASSYEYAPQQYAPHRYAPHQTSPTGGAPHVVYWGGDGAPPSSPACEGVPLTPTAPRSSSPSYDDAPSPKRSPKRSAKCSRNTPACLTFGILLAVSFLVGYVFLIGALVNVSRRHKGGGHRATATAPAQLRSAPVVVAAPVPVREEEEPQYYILQPVAGPAGGGVAARPPLLRLRSTEYAAAARPRTEPAPRIHYPRGPDGAI